MSEPPSPNRPPPGGDPLARRAWPRPRHLRTAAFAALLLVAGLALLRFGGTLFGAHGAQSAPPPAPPGTFRATAQQLKTLTIEPVALHRFVSAELTEGKIAVDGDRMTPVYSPYSGRITRVIAAPGDTVKAGAPLAALAASEFVQAQNDLRTASAQVKLARINEARRHAVYEAKGGSLQDWQQAQADLAATETALAAAQNRLRILGRTDAQIAALEKAAAIDPVATIVAPLPGVVVDRQIGPGQYVQAGAATPVFTIADPSSVWLIANVREADAGAVRVGQAVEVQVLAYPGRTFRARIGYVAAIVDPLTHRLPVRAQIDNRDGALKPEMFATFRILTGAAAERAAVPESAVIYEGASAHVWVAAGDGLLGLRAIRTGRSDAGLVEVLEGLQPGERIVTRGGLFIDQVATAAST